MSKRPHHYAKHIPAGHRPCRECKGRGWFANDMMGTTFQDCKACKGKGYRKPLKPGRHQNPHRWRTHPSCVRRRT